jgi:hypothetical protein
MEVNDTKLQDCIFKTLELVISRTVDHSEKFGMENDMTDLIETVNNPEELWELGHTESLLKFFEMIGFDLNDPMILGKIALLEKRLAPIQAADLAYYNQME